MKGSGGTQGGIGMFFLGMCLAIGAAWLFFDSVRVGTAGYGWMSGAFHGYGRGGGGMMQTTSMGIIFVPFFLGVLALFYNSKQKWAWILTFLGVAILVVEILSRLRFMMFMKTTHLIMMMVMFAAGAAFMMRSYKSIKDD